MKGRCSRSVPLDPQSPQNAVRVHRKVSVWNDLHRRGVIARGTIAMDIVIPEAKEGYTCRATLEWGSGIHDVSVREKQRRAGCIVWLAMILAMIRGEAGGMAKREITLNDVRSGNRGDDSRRHDDERASDFKGRAGSMRARLMYICRHRTRVCYMRAKGRKNASMDPQFSENLLRLFLGEGSEGSRRGRERQKMGGFCRWGRLHKELIQESSSFETYLSSGYCHRCVLVDAS